MIRAIRCDQPTFRTIEFKPGFNVVLAERTKESTRKDSRNGLGKTTLIEIIHFCLGAKAPNAIGLRREPLIGWTFSLEFDVGGKQYCVRRNTENPGRLVVEGDWSPWPLRPTTEERRGEASVSVAEWNTVLGWLMFGLTPEETEAKYTPTFRSLISYFVRKGRDAFSSPFQHYGRQMKWDMQANNAFLLGLNWEHAQQWQLLADRRKALKQLRDAVESGLVSNMVGSIGDLETQKVRLEERIAREEGELRSFRVHPQYRQIEERADELTARIHDLTNGNVVDRRMAEFYKSSFRDEIPADEEQVLKVYEEAGVVLPNRVVKRLEDVRDFHASVVANRRSFLEREIERLHSEIARREQEVRDFSDERASQLAILQTHGALEEHSRLQERHAQDAAVLEEVKSRIANLKQFEAGTSNLRIEKERLQLAARSDYEERHTLRERAISAFNAASEALYEAPGKLILDIGPRGFNFGVEIERSASQGVEQMKVLCYDLMLAQLWSEKTTQPGFLVHDSTIFDGVDERQRAHALELARGQSEQQGFQYICCLNSDSVPRDEFSVGFDLRDHVSLELTDAREDGGLLGIRF